MLQKILMVLVVMVTLVAVTNVNAQTGFTNQGTVNNDDPGVYQVTMSGKLAGTGTMNCTAFDPLTFGFGKIYDTWFDVYSAADSAKLTVKLQGRSLTDTSWVTLATIYSAKDTSGYFVETDTLAVRTAVELRYRLEGVTGNGYSTAWKLQYRARKE